MPCQFCFFPFRCHQECEMRKVEGSILWSVSLYFQISLHLADDDWRDAMIAEMSILLVTTRSALSTWWGIFDCCPSHWNAFIPVLFYHLMFLILLFVGFAPAFSFIPIRDRVFGGRRLWFLRGDVSSFIHVQLIWLAWLFVLSIAIQEKHCSLDVFSLNGQIFCCLLSIRQDVSFHYWLNEGES